LPKRQQVSIDIRMARYTGIGRYIRGIVTALCNRSPQWEYRLIGNEAFRDAFGLGILFTPTTIPIYSIREQILMPFRVRSCDCLHVPHYNAPFLGAKKLIVTIHDLIHLHFSRQLQSSISRLYASVMLPQIVAKADAIIAVSEYTKKDLVETLNVHPGKITVIYHGIDDTFLSPHLNPERNDQSSELYFLYVGLLKAHKNIGVLLKAFQQLKKEMKSENLKLRLVGVPDVRQLIVREWVETIREDSDISLVSNVSDQKLKELYRNARALIAPSLYEGFGFPILEAMALKTPVIAAHATSIPEILGEDAGLYFDPQSVPELVNKMRQLVSTDTLRKELAQRGVARISRFDWATAAKKTEQVYEHVLGFN